MSTSTPTRFAVFDIDGTLIRWQLYHAVFDTLFHALSDAGRIPTETYTRMVNAKNDWKSRTQTEGFRAYEAELVHIVQHHLTDITVPEFMDVITQVFEEYKNQTYRYTRQLITDLKAQGYFLLAISGSPIEIVTKLAEHYGFDDCAANEYVQKNGTFTGEVHLALFRKPELLRELVAKHQLSFEGSVGIGDSEGDIDLLNLVEQPIAFNPSQKLFRAAQQHGWRVVIERKNMVYELEASADGYQLARTNA